MNKKALTTLEFHKVVERLAEHATSERGKVYCEKLMPSTNEDKIRARQKETADAFSRLVKDGDITFTGTHDVTPFAKRLAIGASLSSGELLQVASLLSIAGRVKAYGRPKKDDEPADTLTPYFAALEPLMKLREEIERCIIAEDEIADDASPALKSVRRAIALTNEKIRSEMNKMLSGSARDYLQDTVVTMRNGRYCLPVRAEHKGNVPGMVHDQSKAGSTLFIEPAAVVELNNRLREHELEEQKEIEKILAELSTMVAEHIDELVTDFQTLSELDFIFAKGKLALEMNAVEPLFNTNGVIRLRGARHPLLNPETVVPIDIHLGEDFSLLVITGPNTGGKTVTLKTCGLLTLMGQAGLHIPAKDRSELAIFQNVYADIGDEQSIEQSLSTFSSHMTNIVRILRGVTAKAKANAKKTDNPLNALVLFDELCSGTDPAEGAALAMAILKKLHELDVRTIATTHYSELKVFALSSAGVENAACEFSLETLSPTYRLLIGVPGKSNAFAISKKLGLPESVIDAAKANMTEDSKDFENLLVDLEQKRVAMEKDRDKLRREKEDAEQIRRNLSKKQDALDEKRATLLQEANQEAARIIKQAKDTADETIRDFNRLKAGHPDIAEMEKKRREIGEKLSDAQGKTAARTDKPKQPVRSHTKPEDLHIGDRVKVLSMNLTGNVSTLPDKKNELIVHIGIMKTKVKLNDVIRIADSDETTLNGQKIPGKPTAKTGGKKSLSKAASISTEIKLIGMTVDEAILELDKYLDDAYLSNLPSVRVVHGKGTGALRNAVHEHLRTMPNVSEYHLAEFGEGDSGATIVVF